MIVNTDRFDDLDSVMTEMRRRGQVLPLFGGLGGLHDRGQDDGAVRP